MKKNKFLKLISTSLLFLLLGLFYVPITYAAPVTALSDTLSRVKAATTANHTIVFTTPSGIHSGDTVTLTFPATSFTMGASLTGVTIGGNAVTSATFATNTLTITASATSIVSPGAVATIVIGSDQITNPAIGTYILSLGGTFGDTGSLALAIITEDQIPVTASIDPTFTFTVSTSTLALGVLTSGSVATAGPNTITIASNSSRGYTVTIRDVGDTSLPGLYNAVSAKRIPSATAAVSAGTENYGGTCDVSGSPVGTCSYPTNASNTVNAFGVATPTTFASLAPGSKPASGGDSYSLRVRAAVATTTDAGTYNDTLTVIGTMNF